MDDIVSFGYWVRRRRKALDLTQSALAHHVGCAEVTIKKIELDERRPSRQMAELLAIHLAIPAAEQDIFFRMARGEFVSAPATPLADVSPLPFLEPRQKPASIEKAVFVGREPELAQLDGFLDLALAGGPAPASRGSPRSGASPVGPGGRVVFVTGEAGTGKTVLVGEFCRRAQETVADLIVAGGHCNAYTGVGDPYLPFREILGLLTGDVEARLAASAIGWEQARRLWDLIPYTIQALVKSGPDLIDTFVPGSALVKRAAVAAPGGSGWRPELEELVAHKAATQSPASLQQSDLFEQYTRVLQSLAGHAPLVLILDDLQWADAGSINLLFHLGRQLEGVHLLIIGIYRLADVALGRDGERHPLETVVNELRRHFGQIQIDLGQTAGRQFVDAFLDTQPNRLGTKFRDALYQYARGHALFTVEVLHSMQERGDLIRDGSGCWCEGPALDWETLPARVEGVIEERINRLPVTLQDVLKVASVEGESFTAEVLARILTVGEPTMVHQLSSQLDRQHRLVNSGGSQRLGPGGQRLSHYRFRHYLFQRYLYHNLAEAERVYLHEAVGNQLEQLYGEQTEEVAVELARHFEQAGLLAKAARYLRQAGDRAVRLSANDEALGHFNRALALLETLPETPERNRQELALQIALGAPLTITKGYSAPELEQAFSRAWTLYQATSAQDAASAAENVPQLFQILYGLWSLKQTRAELPAARQLAEQMLDLAQHQGDSSLLMPAHSVVGTTLYWLGEFAPAQEHFEQSMAVYDPRQHRSHVLLFGQDQGVSCLAYQAWNLWQFGFPDQALRRSREAIALAKELRHPHSLVHAIVFAVHLHIRRGEWGAIQEYIEDETALCTEHRLPFWQACATLHRGKVLAEQGQLQEGIALIYQFMAAWRAQGAEVFRPYLLALLADAYRNAGQAEEGLSAVTEALATVEKTAEHQWEAELYRLRGELLLSASRDGRGMKDTSQAEAFQQAQDQAEACFWQAIELARRQEAKSLELRAVMSLSRLWHSQGSPGKQADAYHMLAEIYGWFTEGFDTADLKQAGVLLEQLSQKRNYSTSGRSLTTLKVT